MNIPSEKQCLELLKKYEVPENIIRHSKLVDNVAMYLGRRLKEKGININLKLLHAASLLHDIAKIKCLGKNEKDHGKEARKILENEGFPDVGKVIEAHQLNHLVEGKTKTWEQKILNYADKRAGEKIISLDERFAYLKSRYAQWRKDIEKAEPKARKLERQIFDMVGESPDLLERRLK